MLSFVMVLACILALNGCDKEPSKDPFDTNGLYSKEQSDKFEVVEVTVHEMV